VFAHISIAKPKFFAAHKMVNSRIENIIIKNAPVQVFSINNAQYLTIDGVTVDNSAGTAKGQ
jgi:polygalacturonase